MYICKDMNLGVNDEGRTWEELEGGKTREKVI